MIFQGVASSATPFCLIKDIGLVHSFDGASAQDQEQDQVEDQEAAPDQQCNMDNSDGFMSRLKSKKKPRLGCSTPHYKCGQVPSETRIKKEVAHSVAPSG